MGLLATLFRLKRYTPHGGVRIEICFNINYTPHRGVRIEIVFIIEKKLEKVTLSMRE